VFHPIGLDLEFDRRPVALVSLLALLFAIWLAAIRVPAEALAPFLLRPDDLRPWQVVTSALLHLDGWHLLGNGLYLWVFGRYVEDRLGPWRFLGLFVLFATAGAFAYLWKGDGLPMLGASGAIAGLMGLVLFAAPKAGVRVSLGIWRTDRWRPPVWFLLGLWIAGNVSGAFGEPIGVAYTAHLGGFLAGCLTAGALRAPALRSTGWRLPRERSGGERHSPAYEEMLRGEATWRTIEEHSRTARPGPRTWDVTPPGTG
jgi:membrane associated rhomboid family serine protease